MNPPDSLFIVDGDTFVPTELTRGGWSDDSQHGSPPSGLLARAIEAVPTAVPMQVVRFTIDLFRPVPLTPLTTRTITRRDGRRIQVVDALLVSGDTPVGRATALKIRIADHLDLSEREEEPWEQPPPPTVAHPVEWDGSFGETPNLVRFHLHGVEIRSFDDSFLSYRPGVSWFRLTSPLVAGEEPSPFVRLATLADMSNGNSQALDPRIWLYVNPDITLYAHRLPEGEWVGMRSAAHQHDHGIGLADTRVFDESGPIGRINQSQLIDRH
ncbi:MAG: thioesterase family protein [Acidimicrobiia bacterium]|nr:thioesterase family protein [Acidimicrobiia bacterium]MDH4306185.1 thioesterase family protein [Acidimicrobiia bacterium]MDH5294186.1 thioesterase family protein [Acidimicrobiia bacterium]